MAYFSGYAAHRAFAQGADPLSAAHSVNRGIGEGFEVGAPAALGAIMIMGWTW